MRFLVTAGGTREYIDPVRFIANASSGKMGFALAHAAVDAGHEVTLIHGPTPLRCPRGVPCVPVVSAADMAQAVKEHFTTCDVLIMNAAVADYTVTAPATEKRSKSADILTLHLSPTEDILLWAGQQRARRGAAQPYLVGFALEDRDLKTRAEAKLASKQLDMIVANSPEAIAADKLVLHIFTPDIGWESSPYATKATQARRLIRRIASSTSG